MGGGGTASRRLSLRSAALVRLYWAIAQTLMAGSTFKARKTFSYQRSTAFADAGLGSGLFAVILIVNIAAGAFRI